MDNFRGFLGTERMDKFQNARIQELCGMAEGFLKVFSSGSGMRSEWRLIRLLRVHMQEILQGVVQ